MHSSEPQEEVKCVAVTKFQEASWSGRWRCEQSQKGVASISASPGRPGRDCGQSGKRSSERGQFGVAASARTDERQAGRERWRSEELQFQCHASRHGHTNGTWELEWSSTAEDSSQKSVPYSQAAGDLVRCHRPTWQPQILSHLAKPQFPYLQKERDRRRECKIKMGHLEEVPRTSDT